VTPRLALRRGLALVLLAAGTAAGLVVAVAVGSVPVPLAETVRVLAGGVPDDPRWEVVIGLVRLPRALTAALAGAALGVAGLQMQTLFRNPLADPYVLGVSSGASLGVSLVVLGSGAVGGAFTAGLAGMGRVGVVLAAAGGSGAILGVVLALSRWARSAVTLLIIGVMLGAVTTALTSLLLTWTSPERAMLFVAWGLGSFSATSWADVTVLAVAVGVGLTVAGLSVKSLNALLLGESYARTMGVRVRRVRAVVLLSASLLAGAVTAFCGPIAFLGIAVPHLARLAIGTSDHRVLVPATLLMGAVAALACSVASTLPGRDLVVPVNVITALLVAPVVIGVLLRSRRLAAGAVT
jgi:iron complex transport system permease protein